MGANAQTAVPAFTAGQVLTAAQQTQINTGVPVFATTVTRDAAFDGTGEKVLAEGQFAYIEATNATQYYDGAAWQAVGGASGLTFITGTTFTTATSVSLPTNTFTSTYQYYKLFLTITAVTADADFTMRLRASGTDDSNAIYDNMFLGVAPDATVNNATTASNTAFNLGENDAATVRYNLALDILCPQISAPTLIYGFYNFQNKANNNAFGRFGVAQFRTSTVFDSLTFISSVASSITGNYKVFGYANS